MEGEDGVSSASAVTEARIFPFAINYVQIECGPFSLLPGGYWGSRPPERETSHSPHLVSVRNEKLQPIHMSVQLAVHVRQLLRQISEAGSLHSDLQRCNFNSDDIPCRLHSGLRYTENGSQVYRVICLCSVNSCGTRKNLVKVL